MSQTQNEIKFLHFRDISGGEVNPRGGVTIAFHAFQPSENLQVVEFTAARCSEDDNFYKAAGRSLSMSRLLSRDPMQLGQAGVRTERDLARLLEEFVYEKYGYTRKFSRKRRNR